MLPRRSLPLHRDPTPRPATSSRDPRRLLAFALLAALLALSTAGTASAQGGYAINGLSIISAPIVEPVGTGSASVTVEAQLTFLQTWGSTSYTVEGESTVCVDHSNSLGFIQTVFQKTFSVNLPGSAGTYDLTVQAFSNDTCGGTSSTPATETDFITILVDNTDITSPPIAEIVGTATADVTVEVDNFTGTWGSTEYQVEGQSAVCVNHADVSSFPDDVTFAINLPGVAGTYDLDVETFEDDACSTSIGADAETDYIVMTTQDITNIDITDPDNSTPPAVEIEGGSSVDVTVDVTFSGAWRATSYQVEGQGAVCVDHGDQVSAGGTLDQVISVTAPTAPGEYDLAVTAYANDDCTGDSATTTETDYLFVVQANPDLAPGCGIDVVLVLDESGSIVGTGLGSDISQDVRDGATAFVQALANTGSHLKVIEFNSDAREASIGGSTGYQEVDAGYVTDFDSYIAEDANGSPSNTEYDPEDYDCGDDCYTNWEAALQEVTDTAYSGGGTPLGPTGLPPLVIYFTDGDPTAHLDGNGDVVVDGTDPADIENALQEAIPSANELKALGSHIFVVGVDNPTVTLRNIQLISGFDEYPTPETDFKKGDYTTDVSSVNLEDVLADVALALCRNSLTLTKLVDEDGDDAGYVEDSGWDVSGTVEVTEGGEAADDYEWIAPVSGTADAPDSLGTTQGGLTDGNGEFFWQWVPGTVNSAELDWSTEIEFSETLQAGYVFDGGECDVINFSGGMTNTQIVSLPYTVDLQSTNEYAVCEIRNRRLQVDLQIDTVCNDYTGSSPFVIATDTISHDAGSANVATDVVVTHTFGAGVTYDSFTDVKPGGTSSSCVPSGQTVVCTLTPGLGLGETWEIDYLVTYPGGSSQVIQNTASVSSNEADADDTDNEDTCGSTVPVSLAHVRSERVGDTLRLEWSTALEAGNVGFHVYELGADGERRRLSDALVPSHDPDSLAPQRYELASRDYRGGEILIEEVDLFGRTRAHGPFALGAEEGLRPSVQPIDWPAIAREQDAKADARNQARRALLRETLQIEPPAGLDAAGDTAESGAGAFQRPGRDPIVASLARLQVTEPGLVRVTYEDLVAAGIDLAGVRSADLALLHLGEPIPIRVQGASSFGPGSYLELIAQGVDTIYTGTDVYELRSDAAQALRIGVDGSRPPFFGAPAPTQHEAVARHEEDTDMSFTAPGEDPWYQLRMLTYQSPQSWTVTFDAPALAPGGGPATILADFWGETDWPFASPDHHVRLSLNGVFVDEGWFDGQEAYQAEIHVDSSLLQESGNELQIELPGDTGVQFDMLSYDGLDLRYPRAFMAEDGALRFRAAAERFLVDGLPGPNVLAYRLDETGPTLLTYLNVRPSANGYQVELDGTGAEAEYIVAEAGSIAGAQALPAPAVVDIDSAQADLLVISHPDFLDGLDAWRAARLAQGYRVEIVDLDQVIWQYGHGIFGAEPLRDYIAHAIDKKGTRHVLLVGGDTYDYRDRLGLGAIGFVPTLYAQTDALVKHAPVDALLADADGDLIPDASIGRLPVRSSAELAAAIDKILAYDAKDYGGSAVFSADQADNLVSFGAVSEAFIAELPEGWALERAYLDEGGVAAARGTLLAAMDEGRALTSFVGHSSPTRWTFQGLFSASDAAQLGNAQRPTVVAQWGCWNTFFVSPSADTLAHRFLLSGDRGAAAVLGAATLTEIDHEHELGRLAMPLLTQPGMTIGEALLQAKRQLGATHPEMRDVLLGYMILGDPTQVITP